MKAYITSKPGCPFCAQAKDLLTGLGIEYEETVLETQEARDLFFDTNPYPKTRTFPQIWIDEKHIGGYDNLVEWSIHE